MPPVLRDLWGLAFFRAGRKTHRARLLAQFHHGTRRAGNDCPSTAPSPFLPRDWWTCVKRMRVRQRNLYSAAMLHLCVIQPRLVWPTCGTCMRSIRLNLSQTPHADVAPVQAQRLKNIRPAVGILPNCGTHTPLAWLVYVLCVGVNTLRTGGRSYGMRPGRLTGAHRCQMQARYPDEIFFPAAHCAYKQEFAAWKPAK